MKLSKQLRFVAVSSFALMTAAGAQAQTGTTLEEITVTAQRRSENLQSVPIAITAFTASELERRQIVRTLDILAYVPNLQGHNNTGLGSANTYFLRGIGNTESIPTFDPPVGTYVDDVYIARQNMNNFQFFDVERIEVLRGPQGTLYGRNTTGGSVNVYMRKPGEEFGGFAEVGYGKYKRVSTRASVDVPVMPEKLLTKFSAYYNKDDGYVNNLTTGEQLNGERSYGVRGALQARFSDTVKWDFSTDYANEKYANLINFRGPNGGRVAYTIQSKTRGLGAARINSELADVALGNRARGTAVISNFQVDANENTTINFISGFRHLNQDFMTDGADSLNSAAPNVVLGTPVIIVRGNSAPLVSRHLVDQFSQEVKISGSLGAQLDYVAGFYYFNEKANTNFASLTITPANAASTTADRQMNNQTIAYAGYAQADFKFTDQFKATAGLRYTSETKNVEFLPNVTPLARQFPPFSTVDLVNNGVPTKQVANVLTPRFALNYQATPEFLVYASATRGFKSGGWNARANLAQQATSFGPEFNWTYEAGVHSDWLEKRLRINVNAFYMNDQKFQGAAAFVDPLTNVVTFLTRNFGDMRNYGVEAEISAVPVDNLNVYWSFGVQKAKYANLSAQTLAQQASCQALIRAGASTLGVCNAAVITPTGEIAKPVRVSPFSSTVGFNYTMDLTGDLQLIPSATWNWVQANWIGGSNPPGTYQPSHSTFNAGITLKDSVKGWAITADCTNCNNTTYQVSFITFQYLNEPVRWSLRARYDF